MSQAEAREVVATRAVIDAVVDDTLEVTPIGTVELRNISNPLELFRVRRGI